MFQMENNDTKTTEQIEYEKLIETRLRRITRLAKMGFKIQSRHDKILNSSLPPSDR